MSTDTWGPVDPSNRGGRSERSGPSLASYQRAARLLPSDAFALELDFEFKRARQTRTAFTLVIVESASRPGAGHATPDADLRELSTVIGRHIREVDLLGLTEDGSLALVLVDADSKDSERVTKRLASKIEGTAIVHARRVAIGAASFPAQAYDADSLKRYARSRLVAIGEPGRLDGVAS